MSDIVGRLLDEAEKAQRKGHLVLAEVCRDASDQLGLITEERNRLRAERDAAIMDADMQAREAGNMEHNARVLMAERERQLKLLREAHAAMRACGWHQAMEGDPISDGVLEAACTEIEIAFAAMLGEKKEDRGD
jgi:hypothetical protein